MDGGVSAALPGHVVLDRLQTLLADRITVPESTFFRGHDGLAGGIDVIDIELGDRGPAHAGFDQRVDDRPVAPRPVALSAGPFVRQCNVLAASPIAGPAADDRKQVGSLQQTGALLFGERAFDLKTDRHNEVFELLRGVTEGKGSVLVDPSGEGFEMGEGTVDRAVGKSSASCFLDFAAQRFDEGAGDAGSPGSPVIVARL
jgi:hypothetical protein